MSYDPKIQNIIDSLKSFEKNPIDDLPDIPVEGESIPIEINEFNFDKKSEKVERSEKRENKAVETKYNALAASYNQAIDDLENLKHERNFYANQAKNQQDIAVINHEYALKASKEAAENEFREAYDRNDADAMLKAQEKLSKTIFQLSDFDRQKREYKNEDIKAIGNLGYQPVVPTINDPSDDFLEEFLSKHPYLDRNNKKAFNERMAKEFEEIGASLEDKYVMAGHHDHVRSPEFIQEIFNEFASKKNIKPTNSNKMFDKNKDEDYIAPVMLNDNEDIIMNNKKDTNFERLSDQEYFVATTMPDEIIPGIEKCRTKEDKIKLKKYYYSVWKNSPEVQTRLKQPY